MNQTHTNMTLTADLLAELAEKRLPTDPPDGYATAAQIADAVGMSKGAVMAKLRKAGIGHVEFRPPGQARREFAYDLRDALGVF